MATKKQAEKVLGGPLTTAKKEPKKVAALEYERPSNTRKVVRDTSTGEFTGKARAKSDPKGTVTETVAAKPGKFKIPKSLAAAADLYYETRERRLQMEKAAAAVQEQEKLLREHLIDNLPKSQAGGIAGKVARVEISKRQVPKLEDPKKFFAFAHRKGNEDLVKETMVVSAVQARWEAGKTVPGVDTFTIVGLSIHKLK